MKNVKNFVNYIRHAATSKSLVIGAFSVLTFIAITVTAVGAVVRAETDIDNDPDCDTVAIIKCGAFSESELRADYDANKYGDLNKVYGHFGISKSDLNGFKNGIVYRDGRVTVDGKTVATNARTAARWDNPPAGSTKIPGTERAYESGTGMFTNNGQTAFVKMNNGKFEFAIMKSCGNPVKGKPVEQEKPKPKYSCDALKTKSISRNKYSFSSDVTASNGAKLSKVVYDFGDGQKVEKTNPSEEVTHTYAKPGTYTAKVTAYFDVGGYIKSHTSAECTKPIEVKEEPAKPVYECTNLTARKISRTRYEFTATTQASGGATLKDASFKFGDGQTAQNIKPKDNNTVVVEHEYAKAGDYTISATINFNVAGGVKSDTCEAKITVNPEAPKECKPGIPEGDERCEDKPVEEQPKEEKPKEEVPAELPSTGPAQIIGGAIGLGSVAAAGNYYLRSRRDLLGTIFKR